MPMLHGSSDEPTSLIEAPMSLHTTLNLLKLAGACGQKAGSGQGYDKLRQHLGKGWKKDAPIDLLTILESNGLEDALWCLQATLPEEAGARDQVARLFACDCAERALPIWEKRYPDDKRPRDAIAVARRYAAGEVDEKELDTARAAARAAAWAAARAAAGDTAWDTARAAAWAAAWDAAGAAAGDTARAAAGAAAWAWAATWAAARDWQTQRLREYLA